MLWSCHKYQYHEAFISLSLVFVWIVALVLTLFGILMKFLYSTSVSVCASCLNTILLTVTTVIYVNGKDKYGDYTPVKLKQSVQSDPSFAVPCNKINSELVSKECSYSEIQISADASLSGDSRREGKYEVE